MMSKNQPASRNREAIKSLGTSSSSKHGPSQFSHKYVSCQIHPSLQTPSEALTTDETGSSRKHKVLVSWYPFDPSVIFVLFVSSTLACFIVSHRQKVDSDHGIPGN
jgi:hypothetical protein